MLPTSPVVKSGSNKLVSDMKVGGSKPSKGKTLGSMKKNPGRKSGGRKSA